MTTLRVLSHARGVMSAACVALTLAGCSAATENCAPPVPVAGTWHYLAAQDTPAHTSIEGTLSVTGQSCKNFEGTIDVIEIDAQGQSRRLAGVVSGRAVESSSIQFDAVLGTSTRQHIATIAGDSIAGTWLEFSGGGTAATGSFHAGRTSP